MKVELLGPEKIEWPMGYYDPNPHYRVGVGDYEALIKVDPYPAYAPDFEIVQDFSQRCWETAPLKDSVLGVTVISHEFIDRFNGITYQEYVTERADGTRWTEKKTRADGEEVEFHSGLASSIILSAKRIPPHPAMIRYLVVHEYGHAVANYIARQMGLQTGTEMASTVYAKLRELPPSEGYKGGAWHLAPGEVFANDFRTYVMGVENEYWVHPVPQLEPFSACAKWWKEWLGKL